MLVPGWLRRSGESEQASGSSTSSRFPQALVSPPGQYCDLSAHPTSPTVGRSVKRGDISCLPAWADLRSRWAEHVRHSILLLPPSTRADKPSTNNSAQGEYGKVLRSLLPPAPHASLLPDGCSHTQESGSECRAAVAEK